MSIRTEKVQIPVAGAEAPMPAYLAVPEGKGPFPAVIVIEEIFGINAHIRDVTERIAREGYLAIAPDVHHRVAAGVELAYDQAGMQQGMSYIPKLSGDGFRADMDATIALLRARADVKGDGFGVVGFCIGGHLAYLAAATIPDVKATASFYGGGVATFSPGDKTPTVNKSAGIKGRILCFFGGKDPMIPQAHVDAVRAALEAGHVRHEIVVYPEASHAFFCDVHARGSFHAAPAADAWSRVKSLFSAELR